MPTHLQFTTRDEFRKWLSTNALLSEGVWLLLGKSGGPKTLSANEALEEALCYGWIDGQIKSLDDKSYVKYFSMRRASSNWSDKNKALVAKLEVQGLMTEFGQTKIEEAKKNGQWDKPKAPPITAEQIAALSNLLKAHEIAYTNFMSMPPSVQKTYARAYYDAKTQAGRASRMSWMVERLNKNLKPM